MHRYIFRVPEIQECKNKSMLILYMNFSNAKRLTDLKMIQNVLLLPISINGFLRNPFTRELWIVKLILPVLIIQSDKMKFGCRPLSSNQVSIQTKAIDLDRMSSIRKITGFHFLGTKFCIFMIQKFLVLMRSKLVKITN